jgi:hypothetical protein
MARLEVVGTDPAVETHLFSIDTDFRDEWSSHLPRGYAFMTDRYWRFRYDSACRIATTVGYLLICAAQDLLVPPFDDLTYTALPARMINGGVVENGSYLGLTIGDSLPSSFSPDREAMVTSLIQDVNERLVAVNSSYILPDFIAG